MKIALKSLVLASMFFGMSQVSLADGGDLYDDGDLDTSQFNEITLSCTAEILTLDATVTLTGGSRATNAEWTGSGDISVESECAADLTVATSTNFTHVILESAPENTLNILSNTALPDDLVFGDSGPMAAPQIVNVDYTVIATAAGNPGKPSGTYRATTVFTLSAQ